MARQSRSSLKSHGKTAKIHTRHYVIHNYHDHSGDAKEAWFPRKGRRGGVTTPFPLKLHQSLELIEADGYDNIISWQRHGRCFVIHKPKQFVDTVMPQYFNQTKLTSFQRQLNLYGFQRLTRGLDAGGYYHEYFLRGMPFLTDKMVRTRVKGTKVKGASNPDQEPNFYSMPPLHTTCITPEWDSRDDDDEQEDSMSSNLSLQKVTSSRMILSCHSPKLQERAITTLPEPPRREASSIHTLPPRFTSSYHSSANLLDDTSPNHFANLENLVFDEFSHFDHNEKEVTTSQQYRQREDPVDKLIVELQQAPSENGAAFDLEDVLADTEVSQDDATLGNFLDAMMTDPIFNF